MRPRADRAVAKAWLVGANSVTGPSVHWSTAPTSPAAPAAATKVEKFGLALARAAMVCAPRPVPVGGISTAELSSKTMEAKRIKGLYVIGEAVDVTGWLGGYNFQWAWASGWAAAQAL